MKYYKIKINDLSFQEKQRLIKLKGWTMTYLITLNKIILSDWEVDQLHLKNNYKK